jgi:hypothetical protein
MTVILQKESSCNMKKYTITRILLFVLLSILSLNFIGCPKDNPKEIISPPEPTNCEYPQGNRNYTWRLDTVAWFPSWLGGVHSFSDSDAWVMGNIVHPNGESYSAVHWDGHSWNKKVDFLTVLMNANDVTGDNTLMVGVGYRLIVGDKAAITEYSNTTNQWTTHQFETLGELRSVWTDGKGYFIAVGDTGMVYTKNSYVSPWVYQKAPTQFSLNGIVGISKNEIYIHSALSLATGENYHQYWRFNGTQWLKLYDEQDTTGTIVKLQGTENAMYDIAASRCSITDSLKLYLIGWESFLLESKGQELNYHITNLTQFGLPLRNIGRTAFRINLYSPNDLWVFGTRYNFYHWNGKGFQKITIPGLPNDDMQFGWQGKMIKTLSGKVFLPSEVRSQVYVVGQGTPF